MKKNFYCLNYTSKARTFSVLKNKSVQIYTKKSTQTNFPSFIFHFNVITISSPKINAKLMYYSWKLMFTHKVKTYNDHQCHINITLISKSINSLTSTQHLPQLQKNTLLNLRYLYLPKKFHFPFEAHVVPNF